MTTRYYAIQDSLSYTPHALYGDAKNKKPYFILEVKEHYKSGTNSDYEFAIYAKQDAIYVKDGPIELNRWKLVNARPVKSYFDTESIGFDVVDPEGELRLQFFGKAITENGIIKAIEFLRKVSLSKHWPSYVAELLKKVK